MIHNVSTFQMLLFVHRLLKWQKTFARLQCVTPLVGFIGGACFLWPPGIVLFFFLETICRAASNQHVYEIWMSILCQHSLYFFENECFIKLFSLVFAQRLTFQPAPQKGQRLSESTADADVSLPPARLVCWLCTAYCWWKSIHVAVWESFATVAEVDRNHLCEDGKQRRIAPDADVSSWLCYTFAA